VSYSLNDDIMDDIAETAFDELYELSKDKTLTKKDLIIALMEDYNIDEFIAIQVYDAWDLEKNRNRNIKMAEGLKEPHPAHKNRLKTLETFVKEIL
tara:strand:- start:17803 stop:18090 length:288 start_codon:yes stop_codon:yes gene_type:complete